MPAWACCWGGLPGRLVMVSAGPLQLSLGLLGAGPAGGASVTREPRSWLSSAAPPGLVSRGVLADLPSRSLAGLAQLGASRPGRPLAASCPVRALAAPAAPAVDERGGSWLLECVFHRRFAPGGPAPRLGLVECRVADGGAQGGQGRIVVRDAGDEGVQPAAAPGVQDRAGGGEQAHGTPRVVLLCGDSR